MSLNINKEEKMKRSTVFFWIVIITLIFASLACNIPFLGGEEETPTVKPLSTGGSQATTAPGAPTATRPPAAATLKPSETVKPTAKAPNPIPMPLRQGLTSLDTYRLTIRVSASGSSSIDKTDMVYLIENNAKTKSNHWKMTSTTVSADEPKPQTSITEYFKVGDKSCSLSSSSSSTKTPTAKIDDSDLVTRDLADSLSYLVDFNLYVENPTFVAEETLNGVVTNHFKFKVTQLGKDSGAVVKQNSGEYWVAKDGQYLVKYSVILELAGNTSGAETIRTELALELTSINQSVSIAFPPNCTLK